MKLHVQMQIILNLNQFKMHKLFKNFKLVKTILASFLVLVLSSYQGSEFSETIGLKGKANSNKYSEVFEHENSLILKGAYQYGPNVELIVTGNYIILIDKDFNDRIIYFDQGGNLLYSIESGIGGPDEFTEISDISYDYERDVLYVFSEDQYRIFGFNDKAKVVRNLKINTTFYVHEIEHLDNGIFVFYAAQDKTGKQQVNIYDFNSKKLKMSFLKGYFSNIFLTNETNLWKNSDDKSVYVAPYFTNYIYKINQELDLDSVFVKNTLDLNKVSELSTFQELKDYSLNNNENYFIGYYKESKSFRTFIFYDTDYNAGNIYLKNKFNGKRLKSGEIENDLVKTDQDIGRILFLNDDYAYTLNSSEHDEELKKELIQNLNIEPDLLSDEKYAVLNIYKIKR